MDHPQFQKEKILMLLQIWLLIEGPTKKNLKSFKNITIKKKKKKKRQKEREMEREIHRFSITHKLLNWSN